MTSESEDDKGGGIAGGARQGGDGRGKTSNHPVTQDCPLEGHGHQNFYMALRALTQPSQYDSAAAPSR